MKTRLFSTPIFTLSLISLISACFGGIGIVFSVIAYFKAHQKIKQAWKEVLMETWLSIVRHKGRVSETTIWAFHNRILIDNIPIEIVKNNLETLLNTAIEKTNRKIHLKTQATI